MLKYLVKLPPVLLFFVFMLFPAFVSVAGVPKFRPLEEYRQLASRPALSELFQGGSDVLNYTRKLDAWFSDNFATRPIWVRYYTQALYSVFGESDQVHVGRDGWLFYRSVIDREQPAVEAIPASGRAKIVANFAKLTSLLEQRGVRLYVMPVTVKSRFYPEMLPSSAAHARKFRSYDLLLDELLQHGGINVVDSRAILEGAKANGLKIYHQTDFHWTDPAGALAVRPLLESLGAVEGKLGLVSSWRYDVVPNHASIGGQGRALPLLRTPREETVGVKLLAPITAFSEKMEQNDQEWSGTALRQNDQLLAPVFVFGDSYFDAASRAGFFNFFSGFVRARMHKNSIVEAFRNRIPNTRYAIIEFLSVGTASIDAYVQQLITALESDPAL